MLTPVIRRFLAIPDRRAVYDPRIVDWFQQWMEQGCSQETYQKLQQNVTNWEKNATMTMQFSSLYAGL